MVNNILHSCLIVDVVESWLRCLY